MNIKSTLLLKGAISIVGAGVLAGCIALLVQMIKEGISPDFPMLMGIFLVMELSAVPFFIALFQGYQLLHYIDRGIAFSNRSVHALKKIAYCAITIGALYTAGLPHLYRLAQGEDAPGVVLMGMIIIFASLVIALFAAVLERLLKSAIAMKAENELTV